MVANRWQRLKWTVPLILILTTIIDAALPAIFPTAFLSGQQVIISHITLYFIIVFAFYFRESHILIYSFIFGLFYDSYNTTFLGLNAVIYFILAYIVVKVKKILPKNAVVQFMLFIVALTIQDTIVYLFHLNLGVTSMPFTLFLVNRLGPTLIFNIVLGILLHFPTRSLLKWLGWEDYIVF